MDDIEKIKHFVKNANDEELKSVLSHDPCLTCPSMKNCIYLAKGRVCEGVAKELIDNEIKKMESKDG